MTDAMGDELPQANPTVGSTGHVADHIALRKELVDTQAIVADLVASPPRIVGTTSQTPDEWPTTGALGEHYLLPDGTLIGYNAALSPPWEYVGNLAGPRGDDGVPGTVIGILQDNADVPPPGTPSGTLWWVPALGESPPAETFVPGFVGSTGNAASANNLAMTYPAGTASGDVAVMVTSTLTDTGVVAPSDSGWTEVTAQAKQIGTNQIRMWVKLMTSGGSGFNITKPPSTAFVRQSASMMVFRNVQLTAGLPHLVSYAVLSTTDPVSAPTVDPTANSIVCGFWVGRRTGTTTLVVTPPTQWTKATTAGVNNAAGDVGAATTSVQGGYDLDVDALQRPITSGHQWDYNEAVASTTYAFTIALEQKTA